MTIPRGSRVVGLQTRAVARNAGEASSGPSTRASSGKVAREAGAQSSNVPEDDNAQAHNPPFPSLFPSVESVADVRLDGQT
eukprot:1157241-Pelagomonas_calceolata.AAC.4